MPRPLDNSMVWTAGRDFPPPRREDADALSGHLPLLREAAASCCLVAIAPADSPPRDDADPPDSATSLLGVEMNTFRHSQCLRERDRAAGKPGTVGAWYRTDTYRDLGTFTLRPRRIDWRILRFP